MNLGTNEEGSVYYEPNSFDGPKEDAKAKIAPFDVSGFADSVPYDDDDHYTQAGYLYRLMSEEEKERLVKNIVESVKMVEKEEIKLRQIEHFYKVDPE